MAVKPFTEVNPKQYQKKVFDLYQNKDAGDFVRALTGSELMHLDQNVVDACMEIQAALEIIAIQHRWHGYKDLQEHDLPDDIDQDTHTTKVQFIANGLMNHTVPLMARFEENNGMTQNEKTIEIGKATQYTKSIAYNALIEGARILQQYDLELPARLIGQYAHMEARKSGMEKDVDFDKAFQYALVAIPDSGVTTDKKPVGPVYKPR